MTSHRFPAAFLLSVIMAFALCPARAAEPSTAPPAQQDEQVAPPRRLSVDPAAPHELEVVRATSGHLLVKPLVNGQDVGWFIFDTGAGITCIDNQVAARLKMADAGAITASGMGGDKASRLRMLDSLVLGPVTMEGAPVLELELKGFAIFMGHPIAGVIGYEIFGAAVYEIDFESPRIAVHAVDSFALPSGAAWSDLELIRRRPYVHGQIEANEPGLFALDIGSNNSLIAHTEAVNKFKLLDGRETKSGFSGGVGGIKKIQNGTVKTLTICGRQMENVDTSFAQTKEGAMSGGEAQGTIGVGVLRPYRLVVNYPQKKVALVGR